MPVEVLRCRQMFQQSSHVGHLYQRAGTPERQFVAEQSGQWRPLRINDAIIMFASSVFIIVVDHASGEARQRPEAEKIEKQNGHVWNVRGGHQQGVSASSNFTPATESQKRQRRRGGILHRRTESKYVAVRFEHDNDERYCVH